MTHICNPGQCLSTDSTQNLPTSNCNLGIPNLWIPAIFANPESQDWRRPNPVISVLHKFAKMALSRVSNDKNNNSPHDFVRGRLLTNDKLRFF